MHQDAGRSGKDGPHAIVPNTLRGQATPSRIRAATNRLSSQAGSTVSRLMPRVSAWTLSAYLVVVLVFSALILPLVLHRSAWVEAEIVVLAWFLIWATLLTWLAYRGAVLEEVDDARRAWGLRDRLKSVGSGWDLPGGTWAGADDGGCLAAILVVIVVVLLLWLFFSFVLPVVLIVLLILVRSLVGRVTRTADQTRGRLASSAARGAFWAAVYTLPLALGIWVLHSLV